MSRAFMSWISLALDNLFQTQGRIATVWFDEIVLQLPREELIGNVIDHFVAEQKMKSNTADELMKCWVPIQSIYPEYKYSERNPWDSDDQQLKAAVHEVTADLTKKAYPGVPTTDYAFVREVALAGAGVLSSIADWGRLHQESGCSLLCNEYEEGAVKKVFDDAEEEADLEAFSSVAAARVPNLVELSWERIIELRHHRHLEAFRRKLGSMQTEVLKGDTRTVAEIIDEMELSDLRKLAKMFEPSIKSSVIKAIASNAPLSIPVNPVSVALGAADIVDNIERKQKYGWLYFLMDLSQPDEN